MPLNRNVMMADNGGSTSGFNVTYSPVSSGVSPKAIANNNSSARAVSTGSSASSGYSTGISTMNDLLQLQREANEANIASARETNEFNAKEAQKNREWQEMMSNTAHQREVQDLIAAGLNPVLSVMGGNGASTTSGATASGTKANIESGINAMASIIGASISASTQYEIAKLNSATSIANNELQVKALIDNNKFNTEYNAKHKSYFGIDTAPVNELIEKLTNKIKYNYKNNHGILYPLIPD